LVSIAKKKKAPQIQFMISATRHWSSESTIDSYKWLVSNLQWKVHAETDKMPGRHLQSQLSAAITNSKMSNKIINFTCKSLQIQKCVLWPGKFI
jgi:hypothetical protein